MPLRFPGQYFDQETQTAYNYFRHYGPTLGRYYSPDPIGITGGSNPYSYVSNPLQWADPFGLTPTDYKVLYHGTPHFEGAEFSLETAIRNTRPGTPTPGIHLTDDFTRAATGYGRDGQVVRVQVPQEFADSIHQLGGPMGNQPEYFVNTPEGVSVLNSGITHVMPTRDAIIKFFSGQF